MQRFVSFARALPRAVRPMSNGHIGETPGAFRDREHALENQYFNKEELALLEKLKKKLSNAAEKPAAAAAAAASSTPHEVPAIHHGQAYVSLETFQKFARDVLTSLRALEQAQAKKK